MESAGRPIHLILNSAVRISMARDPLITPQKITTSFFVSIDESERERMGGSVAMARNCHVVSEH